MIQGIQRKQIIQELHGVQSLHRIQRIQGYMDTGDKGIQGYRNTCKYVNMYIYREYKEYRDTGDTWIQKYKDTGDTDNILK